MAEAAAVVGLVASIASLVDLGVKIGLRLSDFTAKTSGVPESFRALAERLPLLTSTLQSIRIRAQGGRILPDVVKNLETLVNGIFDQTLFLQQCLDDVIPVLDASRLERILKGMKSLAKEEKFKQAMEKIHRGIDVIVLHQTSSNVDTSDRILRELTQLNLQSSPSPRTFGLCLGRAPLIDPDAFVGRQAEIQQLHTWLSPESNTKVQKVVSVVGVGGLGKTQLSLAYAREHGHQYSSVFWLNAQDESSLRQSMSVLSRMVFPDHTDVATGTDDEASQIEHIRRWLSEPWNDQWLIIFDNYDDPHLSNIHSHTGFDVRSFFPTRVQGQILITTRSPKLTFGKRLMLQKIDDVDLSIAILSQRSGRDMATDSDAGRLAVRLDGLPLALATAGMYLSQTDTSCAEYLQAYESTWMDLHGPDSDELLEYADRTLSSTWTISFNQVSRQDADAAELFKFLAYVSNQDIWYGLIQAGACRGPAWIGRVTATKIRFDRAMTRLRDYSLVEATPNSYRVHQCVHDWIFEHFKASRDGILFLAALDCVAGSVLDESDPQYWTTSRRLLEHANRLSSKRFRELWETCATTATFWNASHTFGGLYSKWDQFEPAKAMLLRALAGKEKALGPDHSSTLNTVNNLGNLYTVQGELDVAEQMILRALAGCKKALGPDHSSTLNTVNSLGNLYYAQGKLDTVEQVYLRALAGREKALGPDHGSTLDTVNNLGVLYTNQGKLDAAEQMYLRALASKEKALGPNHNSTLDTVFNLGNLYTDQGKLDAAEQMYLRALAGKEKALGPDHSSTLNTVHGLGNLFYTQGKLDTAEQTYLRALAGKERALGPDHSSTLDIVNNLGALYTNQGKLDIAEQMLLRALAGKEKALGPDYNSTLDTVYNLGLLYRVQSKLDIAEQMHLRALVGCDETLGPRHTSTLDTVNNLGNLYLAQGKLDAAEQMYLRALVGHEKILGPDHSSTLVTINNLGNLYTDQGKLDAAEQMLLRALASYEKTLGPDHSSTLNTVNNLGRLYRAQGKLDAAERMRMRSSRVDH